jgi:hypothetical protein
MLPHEKALVKRLEKEPFALLGINSDSPPDLPEGQTESAEQQRQRTVENLKKILAENGITWRQAVEGSTDGPLATRWNVSGWPTIYVLDANGVIRYRDVRDEEMTKAVETLLAEIAPQK